MVTLGQHLLVLLEAIRYMWPSQQPTATYPGARYAQKDCMCGVICMLHVLC